MNIDERALEKAVKAVETQLVLRNVGAQEITRSAVTSYFLALPNEHSIAATLISETASKDALLKEAVEVLREQVAFHAMDLTFLRGHAEPERISDIEMRRDRARAFLDKIGDR